MPDSLRCRPEPRPQHFNPRSRPFKPRARRSKRQPRGFLLCACCFLQQHHDAFCSVIGAWRLARRALWSTRGGSNSAIGTFCSKISSSELGGRSFAPHGWCFELDRWSSELDGRSFLLGGWSSELDCPSFLLDGWSSELGGLSFLLGEWSSELGGPSFLLDGWSSELDLSSFLLHGCGSELGSPSCSLLPRRVESSPDGRWRAVSPPPSRLGEHCPADVASDSSLRSDRKEGPL